MNMQASISTRSLQQALLARLFQQVRDLRTMRDAGIHEQGAQLFTYCAQSREVLKAVTLDHPMIGVVLHGCKEIWIGDVGEVFKPGTVFCLPRDVAMDAVNIPSERDGIYASLIFNIVALPPALAVRPGTKTAHGPGPSMQLRLTGDLIEAIAHAATAIAGQSAREDVKTLRLTEMLALMRDDPAARHVFARDLVDELGWQIAARPDHPWTVAGAAAAFGIGGSTLRRHLARNGTSFRTILTATRMETARRLIGGGMPPGAASEATGYASRSHFARHYRAAFGILPSGRGGRAAQPRRS